MVSTAQKGAHVVKDGIRHKDVYANAFGDTVKAYFFPTAKLATGSPLKIFL